VLLAWAANFADTSFARRDGGPGCYAAVWSPDGACLTTCHHDTGLIQWDAGAWVKTAAWPAHEGSTTNTLASSADGSRLLTCSWDATLGVWDAATRTLERTIPVGGGVYHCALSPDGRTAAAVKGKELALFNAGTGELLHTLAGHEGAIRHVEFSHDGQSVLTASSDATIAIWNVAAGTQKGAVSADGPLQACSISPDGSRVAGSGSGSVTLWNRADASRLWHSRIADGDVYRVAFTPDGSRLAAASARGVQLLDAATGEVVLTLRSPMDGAWALAFSPDGSRLAACSTDGSFTVFDTASVRERVERRNRSLAAHAPDQPTRGTKEPPK
jgi:WD40 repeat protein